jgi:hypothetical protein
MSLKTGLVAEALLNAVLMGFKEKINSLMI